MAAFIEKGIHFTTADYVPFFSLPYLIQQAVTTMDVRSHRKESLIALS